MKRALGYGAKRLAIVAARMAGVAAFTAIAAATVMASGPAAGDQVANLKSQATQIARDLVLEQLQIGVYQQQYAAAGTKVTEDEAKISATQSQIAADSRRVSRDRKRSRHTSTSTRRRREVRSCSSGARVTL
jgi:parvulin-like peptidyl-prolyl isomerase